MVFIKEKAPLLFVLLIFFSCNNQMIDVGNTPEEKLALIEKKFAQLQKDNKFHGAILVAKDGNPIFENAYGSSTAGMPNTASKQFDIASIGKMFTGVAIMKLVEHGQLDLDKTVFDYLPDYGNSVDTKQITIHQLLTHSSGIPDIFTFEKIKEIDESKIDNWYDYFPYFENDKLDFKPGKKWSYSNSGYLVLGKVIEAISGQDYCSFLSENIFKQAEMTEINCGFPAGGSQTNMQELLNFSKAFLQYRLLNESTTNSAIEDKVKIEKDVYYGYGFQVYKRYKSLEVSHKGGTAEIKGQLLMFTETGYTVIIYGNNNNIGYDGFNEARHYLREVLT